MRAGARIIVLLALGAGLLYAGCGIKSRPLPPEEVRPQRITDLVAVSVPTGIRIRWSRPEHYTGGGRMRDLGRFEILRASGGELPAVITQVSVTDLQRFRQQHHFSFVDTDTEIGHRYRYLVVSITTDGYESLPSNQAEIIRTVPKPTPNPETFVLPTPVPLPK
ncbi:MAG TPA: hypothetical protein VFE56_06220 [Candidatus Binataceae bacterium]|jgi:hypothetical protein|nr:hypothetical protein [Candidatus Binataceae bacterium]